MNHQILLLYKTKQNHCHTTIVSFLQTHHHKQILHITYLGTYAQYIQAHWKSTHIYPIFQTLIAKLKTSNIPFYKPKSKSKSLNPYNQQKLNP